MEAISKFIVFLSQFDISNSKYNKVIEYVDIKNPFKSFIDCPGIVTDKVLTGKQYTAMKEYASEENVDKYIEEMAERGIKVVTIYDEEYPSKLLNLPDAPNILYCKGNYDLMEKPALAVVGTREPSRYGILSTEMVVKDVAACGIVIVSGLAYGIDGVAHRKCLSVGGFTIAVLAGGFDNIFPSQHKGLADEIVEKGGLLVSEYRPKAVAQKYTFPIRNRIIAGLGDGVLISEAGMKSGTIYTKNYALEYGKNVYALPGQIDSKKSYLPNTIIKDGQASLVMSGCDILADYHININNQNNNLAKNSGYQLSVEEEKVCACLENGMKNIDDVAKITNLNINILNTCLTTLEINEIIRRLPGGMIALCK